MLPPWLRRPRPVTRGRPIISAPNPSRNKPIRAPWLTVNAGSCRCKNRTHALLFVSTESPMVRHTPAAKPRVLVLDEDRIILQSLSQFLRREGYDVRTTDQP